MAAPDLNKILHVPGRLAVNPTNLSTAWPHGGTGLGVVGKIFLDPQERWADIPAEERGAELQDSIYLGEQAVLRATLRTPFDDEAQKRAWPNTAAGSITTKRVTSSPGSFRAGAAGSDRALVLAFTPNEQARHPALLLYRTWCRHAKAVSVPFSLAEETVLLVEFPVLLGEASDRLYAFGLLEDLSL